MPRAARLLTQLGPCPLKDRAVQKWPGSVIPLSVSALSKCRLGWGQYKGPLIMENDTEMRLCAKASPYSSKHHRILRCATLAGLLLAATVKCARYLGIQVRGLLGRQRETKKKNILINAVEWLLYELITSGGSSGLLQRVRHFAPYFSEWNYGWQLPRHKASLVGI